MAALKAGPKTRNLAPLPPKRAVVPWIEHATGQKLYPWQREVLRDLTGPKRPRVAYVQVPRKNGKTRLAAALAIVEICLKTGRHVYAIADSERNLNSVLMLEIRELILGSEHLRDSIHIFKDRIEVPETGSFIQTRASNFKASQGINPHLVLFDEVHLQTSDSIWSGMQMAGAARTDALLLGITTPGYDLTSMAHGLYQAVKAGDPTVYGKIYEGEASAALDDRDNWNRANPCYSRGGFADTLAFDVQRLPAHEFRRYRLGEWTATASAWLPYGVWENLTHRRELPPAGTRVWLGFDGSYSGDSTALVGCTHEGHIFVVGAWEKPGAKEWRVPRDDVMQTVEQAFEYWDVRELACDPPYWQAEIAQWSARWRERVVEIPTYSRARMAPACTGFYAAVMDGALTHDGDPRLARHLANCHVVNSPQGDVITKADKDSPAKIDLAVAAVLAHSRASIDVAKPKAKPFVLWT
ncbi:terminase large subunit [Mycolicibacterium sp. Y3]